MPIDDQTALVARIKAELVARGVIPAAQTSNEHAAAITWRVAWSLRNRGAGLIPKTSWQNGATDPIHGRFSHDAIAFSDGWVDVLVGAGPPANENKPAWQWTDQVIGARTVPFDLDQPVEPAEPVDPPIPAPIVPPAEPPAEPWPADQQTAAKIELAASIDRLTEQLEKLRTNGVPFRLG